MTDRSAIFLDQPAIDDLVARAHRAPRRRLNLNLHADLADPIQRFLNAGEPGSYIRPHRHTPQRWELFAVLQGGIDMMLFADDGTITHRMALRDGGVVEIPGGTWHSFVFAAPGSVTMEIKPGPYIAQSDKEFAAWAAREEDAEAARCADWLATASVGQRWDAR
jgi:cupin fold WbuC family metalloprotein